MASQYFKLEIIVFAEDLGEARAAIVKAVQTPCGEALADSTIRYKLGPVSPKTIYE